MPSHSRHPYTQPIYGGYGGPSRGIYAPQSAPLPQAPVPLESLGQPYGYAPPAIATYPYQGTGLQQTPQSARQHRGQRFRPVDPFSRSHTSQSTQNVSDNHSFYPAVPPTTFVPPPPPPQPVAPLPYQPGIYPVIPPAQQPPVIIPHIPSVDRSSRSRSRSSRRSRSRTPAIIPPTVIVIPRPEEERRGRSRTPHSRRSPSPHAPTVIVQPIPTSRRSSSHSRHRSRSYSNPRPPLAQPIPPSRSSSRSYHPRDDDRRPPFDSRSTRSRHRRRSGSDSRSRYYRRRSRSDSHSRYRRRRSRSDSRPRYYRHRSRADSCLSHTRRRSLSSRGRRSRRVRRTCLSHSRDYSRSPQARSRSHSCGSCVRRTWACSRSPVAVVHPHSPADHRIGSTPSLHSSRNTLSSVESTQFSRPGTLYPRDQSPASRSSAPSLRPAPELTPPSPAPSWVSPPASLFYRSDKESISSRSDSKSRATDSIPPTFIPTLPQPVIIPQPQEPTIILQPGIPTVPDHQTPVYHLPSSPPIKPNHTPGELPYPASTAPRTSWWKQAYLYATDAFPRQLYLNMLLHLPALYYSRVTKVFTDAELCLPDIEKMFRLSDNDVLDEEMFLHFKYPQEPKDFDAIYLLRFKSSWEEFINNIISEWQAQNVVSVLLLSAVLTLLQIDDIGQDPVSRSSAIFSLLFALLSLLHGCVLMARFGSMKKLNKAAIWAEEAQRTTTHILWNVWVFLSMPAVWLAWSVVAFIVTLLSYVWRTGTGEQYEPPSDTHALGFRIVLSAVFAIGLVYFLLVLRTLARYGSDLERQWEEKVVAWKQLPPPFTPIPATPPLFNAPNFGPGPAHIVPYSPTSSRRLSEKRSFSFHDNGPRRYSPGVDRPRPVVIRCDPSSTPEPRPVIHVDPYPTPESPRSIPTYIGEEQEFNEHVQGPYETLITAGERMHVKFDHPSKTQSPHTDYDPDDMFQESSRIIYDFPVSEPFNLEMKSENPDILVENYVLDPEWDQFRSDISNAWEGKLEIPLVPLDELYSLRTTIVDDILRVWNDRYFASRGLGAITVDESEGPHVTLYKKHSEVYNPPNEGGFPVMFAPSRLSSIEELEEDRYKRRSDNKMTTASPPPPSSKSLPPLLESPQLVLPYLPQLDHGDWDGSSRVDKSSIESFVAHFAKIA